MIYGASSRTVVLGSQSKRCNTFIAPSFAREGQWVIQFLIAGYFLFDQPGSAHQQTLQAEEHWTEKK